MHRYNKEHGLICEKIKRNFLLKYEEKKYFDTLQTRMREYATCRM